MKLVSVTATADAASAVIISASSAGLRAGRGGSARVADGVEPAVENRGMFGMDLIVSAEDYRRVARSFDGSIEKAKVAQRVIEKGMLDIGQPWSPDGMSKEFGVKFPESMESLARALGEVVAGLASLKKSYLVMADNAQAAEDANSD
jgi:hypothetical protein